MKYMGSKNRYAKHLLPIILKDRYEGQWYVEPFVGGGNMIDKVTGNRIGSDLNKYLIDALQFIQSTPYDIPDVITEDFYTKCKEGLCEDWLRGYVGFSMSFGGKWFGGYRRDVAGTKGCFENMKTQSRRSKQSAIKQSKLFVGISFVHNPYKFLEIPDNSIIYCDPPYAGTTGYKVKFDHDSFWQWCRDKTTQGHAVFISEYKAPSDFECLWEKEVNSSLTKNTGGKKGVERLFRYKS